ncbi:MAG: restriction endonuclease subunit S [Prolixibacteraceae bacterium]|nr:restriction endonuclease subunit S [Prolixibacteraceae bacterium]
MLSTISHIHKGTSIKKTNTVEGEIPVIAGGQEPAYYHNEANRQANVITVSASGAYSGFINFWSQPIFASDCNTIISKDEKIISTKLLYYFLKSIQNLFYSLQRGQAQPHVYASDIERIKIPLLSNAIQLNILIINIFYGKVIFCLLVLVLLWVKHFFTNPKLAK